MSARNMLGADAGVMDSGGWQNRHWQTGADGGGQLRRTAEGSGLTAKGGRVWMAADGSGGIKLNMGGC